MTDKVIVVEDTTKEKVNLTEVAQKVLHLGLGAAVIAQEEVVTLFEKAQSKVQQMVEQTQQDASELVDKMVERGTSVEEDSRQRVNGFVKERKKQVNKAQNTFEDQIERVLHRMNVPTKNDIEKLEKKLTTLTKKVNELAK